VQATKQAGTIEIEATKESFDATDLAPAKLTIKTGN
jgi:hypothetical protein